ncbi:hypothetical protein [Spirulina sp. 06S082]|uniref:hypothetical protein n=1 Tax=Spirulina sp. 06S082 TaxID=3110248 RepID=UPI002B1F0F00|nr:hypothetical protein [Spirulina sp. 06S082]MEA5468384.1 hypothetical protein [Spirulina sp. 06S082]
MPNILIWTPESDFDSKAVCCIAEKIVKYYGVNITISESTKKAFERAIHSNKGEGLEKMVNIYLTSNDCIIFLLDSDGVQSQAQRRKEPNSLINRIKRVVSRFPDRVHLILIKQELEAWLLVDVLGICCYFTKNENTRKKEDWVKLSKKYQTGDTQAIAEAESGGRGAKEYLVNVSRQILKKINPKLKDRDAQKRQYTESMSPKIARYMEIDKETLSRNESLQEFALYFESQTSQ